jgi:hypothetical protein
MAVSITGREVDRMAVIGEVDRGKGGTGRAGLEGRDWNCGTGTAGLELRDWNGGTGNGGTGRRQLTYQRHNRGGS